MTTPPSLPPAMDPHQMNATPPCPNATPEKLRHHAAVAWFAGKKAFESKPTNALWDDAAITAIEHYFRPMYDEWKQHAPLPTVAPHLAELVKRLESVNWQLARLSFTQDGAARQAITDAISALTQLAGEVERLKFYIATTIQPEEHAKVITDLRHKLAASERECVRLREQLEPIQSPGSWAAVLTERQELRTQLAALAGCLEPFARVADEYDKNGLDECRPEWNEAHDEMTEMLSGRGGKQLLTLNHFFAAHIALAAHRATGGAGEKAT